MLRGSEISYCKHESKKEETNLWISDFLTELKSYRYTQTGTRFFYSTRSYQGSIVETNDDSEQLLSVLSGEALYFALVILSEFAASEFSPACVSAF